MSRKLRKPLSVTLVALLFITFVLPSGRILVAENEPPGKFPTMKVVDDKNENELTLEILHEDEVINVQMVKEDESTIKVNTKKIKVKNIPFFII